MRYNFLVALLIIALAQTSFAQEKRNHGVIANIATAIFGNYEISYEQRFDKHFSLSTSAIYYDTRKVLVRVYSYGIFAGLGIVPKFHLYGDAHKSSVYLAPSLRLGYLYHPAMDATQKSDQGVLSRLGANFGYQHVFASGLMLDFAAGLEHYYSFNFAPPTRYQSSSEKLKFDLRPYFFSGIGYAF